MSKSRLLTPLLLGSITVVASLMPISSAFAACNDCHWLFVRCMSRADTPEKAQACDESRALCEETFCSFPNASPFAALTGSVSAKSTPLPTKAEQARALRAQRTMQ